MRAAVPVMRRQGGGRILNTASVAGLVPVPGMLPYVTSKHAVVGLSLGLRAEVAGDGIGVSVLCPSAVDTAIFEHVVDPPASLAAGPREIMRRVQPRFLTAEHVADRALRGLERDQAVIAVGLVAQLAWRATRVSPGLVAGIAAAGGRAHRRRLPGRARA